MNKIPCQVASIAYDEGIAFVKLAFGSHYIAAMLLGEGERLASGQKLKAVFKESEVMVCDKSYSKISARNRFVSKVLKTEVSSVIARVIFEFEGLEISALISAEAYNELGIEVGKTFGWFVKSSEVMLEYV
ncbi:TOBE domain-containing protein [Helicobacter sp. 11S02596-1]|uniref:TOBE domain-containing protein n=1 Tax=Helicobacter sp. 11S02596-1 TaxID=1476194 RepID=UPI000BA6220D|nr:TOBE domain-containing protein [Helicobacter sp. 11S02596-1]PAF42430.1 hypothetical protein BJI48_06365 [Helicobacter sp. 11S02596-1]